MEKTTEAERYTYKGTFEIPFRTTSKKTTLLHDQSSLDETNKLLEELTSAKTESVRVRSREHRRSATGFDDLAS
jgi:hypothetical protein